MSYTPDQLLKITANYENMAVKQATISEEMDDMYDAWLMKVKNSLERKGLSIMDFTEEQLHQAFDRWARKEGHRLKLQDQGEKGYHTEYHPHEVSIEQEYPAGESAYEMMRPERFPVEGGPKKSKHEQEALSRQKNREFIPMADDHIAQAEAAFGELLLSLGKKDKKKLDPKAKVRNRGTVCVPAESAKDKKDHFPINDEDQARNALARVHQYSSAPSWYKGSLKGLQDLVSRKVHSKYPSIGKSDKKKKSSSFDDFERAFEKWARKHVCQACGRSDSFQGDGGIGDICKNCDWEQDAGLGECDCGRNDWSHANQQCLSEARENAGTSLLTGGLLGATPSKPEEGVSRKDIIDKVVDNFMKKRKESSSLEADLMSFAEEVRGSFLAEGQAQQPGAQQAQAQPDPQVTQAQTILAESPTYKQMLGPTGIDGKIGHQGSHTRRALQAWKAEMAKKDQRYAAQMTDEQIVAAVIASKQQQPQQAAFDAKKATDQLYTYQGHLNAYRDASKTQSIQAQGAPEIRNYLDTMEDWANATLNSIAEKLKQQNISDQEKQQLTAIDPKIRTLNSDIQVWRKYLDAKFPRSTMATASKVVKLLNKYAQLPADPTWSGSQIDKPAAQPAAGGGQPAAKPGQPAQTGGQPGQPAAKPADQGQQQQQQAPKMSADQIKKWTDFLESYSKQTQDMIEGHSVFLGIGHKGGINDFKDADNFPLEKLEEYEDRFNTNLGNIAKAKENGLESSIDYDHKVMLQDIESRLRIIIRRLEKEKTKRERSEDRADREAEQPQQRGQPMGLVRAPRGYRGGYNRMWG